MSDDSIAPATKPQTVRTSTGETSGLETVETVEAVDAVEVVETPNGSVEVVETPNGTVVETPVEVTEVKVTENEPVVPTTHPDDVVTSVPRPQIIYVTAPAAPRPKGNRGFGALIALVAAVLFTVLLALASAVIGLVADGSFSFSFLTNGLFYAPVLAFLIGFVLLVLIVNRAAWWTYIIGSIFVALFVYFGTIGFGMLSTGVILESPEGAARLFASQLANPFVIVSALLAREVSMWVGAGIAARGRRVKARNLTARETYDRELAEKRAEHERGAAVAV